MTETARIDKLLAGLGYGSRREVESLMHRDRVLRAAPRGRGLGVAPGARGLADERRRLFLLRRSDVR